MSQIMEEGRPSCVPDPVASLARPLQPDRRGAGTPERRSPGPSDFTGTFLRSRVLMKKYCSLLAAVVVLVLLALGSPWITSAVSSDGKSASEGTKKACPAACGRSGACADFIDEDKSGVCDWKEMGLCGAGQRKGWCAAGAGAGFIDEDGDGICDRRSECSGKGRGQGGKCQGQGFVDEDKDGVCDRRQSGDCPGGRRGMGRGKGAGRGAGFVDADGDGICDHRQR
jgi:hypothetical protein